MARADARARLQREGNPWRPSESSHDVASWVCWPARRRRPCWQRVARQQHSRPRRPARQPSRLRPPKPADACQAGAQPAGAASGHDRACRCGQARRGCQARVPAAPVVVWEPLDYLPEVTCRPEHAVPGRGQAEGLHSSPTRSCRAARPAPTASRRRSRLAPRPTSTASSTTRTSSCASRARRRTSPTSSTRSRGSRAASGSPLNCTAHLQRQRGGACRGRSTAGRSTCARICWTRLV